MRTTTDPSELNDTELRACLQKCEGRLMLVEHICALKRAIEARDAALEKTKRALIDHGKELYERHLDPNFGHEPMPIVRWQERSAFELADLVKDIFNSLDDARMGIA